MTVTESERRHLQEALVHQLGEPAADTLMTYLPPVGWADVATKADLDTLHTVLRSDMTALEERLRREVGQQFGTLRGELNDLGTELRGGTSKLGTELRAQMTAMEVRLNDKLRGQFYWTMAIMITSMTILLTAFTVVIKS